MADKKMELIVNVNVTSAGSAVAATSVNTVGIVTFTAATGTEATDKKYGSADAVATAFGEDSEAHKMAKIFFAQDTKPASLYVVYATAQTAAAITTAVSDAKLVDVFHWALVIDTPTTKATEEETFELLKALNTWAAANYKLFHVEIDIDSGTDETALKEVFSGFKYTPTGETDEVSVAGLTKTKTKNVAIYAHDIKNDYVGVAIAADRCGVDPARGTWAHKELTGVAPDELTKDQLDGAISTGYNVYTSIANSSRLFMGTTCGPTDFIDTVVKAAWIKFRTQEAVFALLQSGNDGYGIDMSDDGIAAIGAKVTEVLTQAYKNHYIMDGFTVSLPAYADIPVADKNIRRLSGIKASVKLMDSVHTVVSIDITAEANN